jgi:hypothetical protein
MEPIIEILEENTHIEVVDEVVEIIEVGIQGPPGPPGPPGYVPEILDAGYF